MDYGVGTPVVLPSHPKPLLDNLKLHPAKKSALSDTFDLFLEKRRSGGNVESELKDFSKEIAILIPNTKKLKEYERLANLFYRCQEILLMDYGVGTPVVLPSHPKPLLDNLKLHPAKKSAKLHPAKKSAEKQEHMGIRLQMKKIFSEYHLTLIVGAVAVVLGLIGILILWQSFLQFLSGAIPVILLFGGVLGLYLGFDELKDTWKKEEIMVEAGIQAVETEKYNEEIEELTKEIEVLKDKEA
jgi:hypothetical protein